MQTRYRFSGGIRELAEAVHSGEVARVKQVFERELPYKDVHKITGRKIKDTEKLYASEDKGYQHYLKVMNGQRPPLGSESSLYDEWATNVLKAFSQFQILCALREGPWGVAGLNQQILKTLHGNNFQINDWYEGRPVLVTQNDYSLNLMNGDIGIALKQKGELRVAFRLPDGSIRWVSRIRLPEIETAYAMTVHKSQGSEFSDVLLVLPEQDNPVLTRELIYTGITRAREQLYVFLANSKILELSITRRVQRSGNLFVMLEADLNG
ncbi:exodeoxyribonuclease V alpha subunit [Gammaproteobacteria bacterium]